MPLVDELPYRPWAQRGQVVEGEFRWRLGTHPLDLANWIEWGSDASGWIDEKPALLAAHRDTVFSVLDGIEPEADEVASAIAHHVGADLDTSMHPLEAAARLVPDDLVLMVERDDRFVFGGGAVCFPNRWDLPSKIGRTMAEVHAPVADLNRQLEPAIDAFFDRLRPERSFWRLGWGLIDSPDGFEPPRSSPRPSVHPDDDDVHVRVERETLRRFPVTNCVLFTIRTYLAPITSLSADDRARIRAAVAAMTPDMRAYKDVASG